MGGKEFPLLGNNLTAILAGPAVRQLFSRRLRLADGRYRPRSLGVTSVTKCGSPMSSGTRRHCIAGCEVSRARR